LRIYAKCDKETHADDEAVLKICVAYNSTKWDKISLSITFALVIPGNYGGGNRRVEGVCGKKNQG
jgi:hypothetical protein